MMHGLTFFISFTHFALRFHFYGSGEHTDYGSITMVFQEQWGGLEVLGKDNKWHHVEPVKNAIVVNIADCLQRWRYTTHYCVEVASISLGWFFFSSISLSTVSATTRSAALAIA